jgi:hypothetical protein
MFFLCNAYYIASQHAMKKAQAKEKLDIINEILEDLLLAFPVSPFIISLYKQYQERGSLSKKQLEGLYAKASGVESINPGKLATVEAIIKKMPNRYRSEKPEAKEESKENALLPLIQAILQKYPQHKAVKFMLARIESGESLTAPEIQDINRISKLVIPAGVVEPKGEGGK